MVVAAHVLVGAALMWWTWRKWPDPLIDFGRELYVPWQITRGKVLQRDIASLFGPLSPYVNALWFRLFGVSLTTLAACNAAILAATIAGIHHLLGISTDRATASAATLATLLLFGFSQYVEVGNYNFICPYSHEATHGVALSVAALVALHHAVARSRASLFAVAGACFGLVLLTKPEISLAAAAAVAAGWAAATVLDRADGHSLGRGAAAFVVAASAPPLVFLGYFHFGAHMPWPDARGAVAEGWITAFTTPIANNVFYLRGMGLDDPAGNALRMGRTFAGFVGFVLVATAFEWTRPQRLLTRALRWSGRLALLAGALFLIPWYEFPRAFPLIAILGCAACVVLFARRCRDRDEALELLPIGMWSAFAVVLLAKMWLNVHIYRYGFYLALPATTVTIALTMWLVPNLIDSWSDDAGRRVRLIFAATLAVATVPYLALSEGWYRTKVVPVGSGGDRFLASNAPDQWQGVAVQQALEKLDRMAPHATVAVLPEGVMLNYLSRRETPLRVLNFMPPEVIAFGERAILQSLERHPPDFVLLVHKDTSEYGYPSFGADPRYGLAILTWIRSHYATVGVIARDPGSGVGIEILGRFRSLPS